MDNLDTILKEITNNIVKENKGYMDLLFVIYNNMVTLEESNPEVNKKIIYSLANLLQN